MKGVAKRKVTYISAKIAWHILKYIGISLSIIMGILLIPGAILEWVLNDIANLKDKLVIIGKRTKDPETNT